MKPYEGTAAYKAGIREGRVEAIDEFYNESTKELAVDCYNYINGMTFREMDILFKDKEPVSDFEIKLP